MSQNLNQLPYGERFLASSQDPTLPGKPLADNFLRPYVGLGSITYYGADRKLELLCSPDPGEPEVFTRAGVQGELDLVQSHGLRFNRRKRDICLCEPSPA